MDRSDLKKQQFSPKGVERENPTSGGFSDLPVREYSNQDGTIIDLTHLPGTEEKNNDPEGVVAGIHEES